MKVIVIYIVESKYSLVHIFYKIGFPETQISHTICSIFKLENLKGLSPSVLHHDDKQVQLRVPLKSYSGGLH